MRAMLIATCALLMLSGCKTAEQKVAEAAEQDATCRSYGVKPGSDAYVACRMNLTRVAAAQEESARTRRAIGFMMLGQGLQQAGANMSAAAAANRPVHCTSNRFGNTVTTNCY